MPITDDPSTGEPSDLAFGIDVHAAIAGEPSLWDEASDFVTKAVPLTGLAIVNSFVNTGVAIDNWLGGDATKATIQDEVGDGDMNDYYNQHQQGIEGAGLLVGSLIPGTIGVKALRLAQAGKMTETLQAATNIFAGPKAAIVEDGLAQIAAGEQGLIGSLKADKFKAIALGFGDNALEGLAFTAASTAAQQGSPLLDEQSLGGIVDDLAMGALAGGAVGGLISGIQTNAAFKRAFLAAKQTTKTADLVTRYGDNLKSILAGDNALGIVRAVDAIPEQSSSLGQTKAAANRAASIMDAKLALKPLVDDPQVASDFLDTLLKMKENGAKPADIYDKLNRLAKIQRITDDNVQPSGDIFFINRFAKGDFFGFDQLITKEPEAGAKFAQAYRISADATKDPSIARASDTSSFGNTTYPTFSSSKEAFDAGHDVFINSKLQAIVNPNSDILERVARDGESRALTQAEEKVYRETMQLPAGAKPLLGGLPKYGEAFIPGADSSFANKPLIFNLMTGDVSETAVPVVGDYGKVERTGSGLRFGDKFSPQSLTEGLITADTSSLDANARYTWAGMRGLKNGDAINPIDTPMLEQLYAEATKPGAAPLVDLMVKKRITWAGEAPATTTDDLLAVIRQQKNALLVDGIAAGNDASNMALRANVSQDYIAGGMVDQAPEQLMKNTSNYQRTNNVKLWFDIGNIQQRDGMIMQGLEDHAYRMQLLKDIQQSNLAHFVSGEDWDRFILKGTSADADPVGVRPGILTSSQSDYGSLGQMAERVGRNVAAWIEAKGAEVSRVLSPSVNALRNDMAAAAEASMFTAVRQRTRQVFKFLPDALAAQHFVGDAALAPGERVAVLKDALQVDPATKQLVWDKTYLPPNFITGEQVASGQTGPANYYVLSPKVAAFEEATRSLNSARVIARNNWKVAQGLQIKNVDPDSLFAPAIDTRQYNHFALVKQIAGTGMADDSVSMIVAKDGASLQQKIAALGNDFSVWTKDMLAKNHQILGDYESGRNFVDNKVNSELARRGILNDVFPDTRIDTLIQRHVDWHSASESSLIRDHVETGNDQLFSELRAMGDRFTAADKSTFGRGGTPVDSKPFDPYRSYIDTALNIKQRDNYRPWALANEKVEAFFDTAFSMGREAFGAAKKGVATYEQAVAAAKKFGLGDVYGDGVQALKNYSDNANKLPPQRYLAQFLAKASSAMNYTVIRLDAWQQLVHVLSTPILMAAELHSANDAVKSLTTTALPDLKGAVAGAAPTVVPATSKLIFNAVNNLFSDEVKQKYLPLYEQIGAIRNPDQELIHRAMREEMTLPFGSGWKSESQLAASGSKLLEYASKLSNWTEFGTSFVAADAARQLFEAKGLTGRELSDNIASFVNRVKGNMVASQRPIAFQGPLGQAVGLFQTYQMNMMQNLFRYVGNSEGKAIAIAAGLQGSLFGLQSLPGFQLLNSAIIGNAQANTSHADLYSTLPSYFGKKISDYLTYGVASNVLNASLFTRGDMNPRNLTLLPVNPLDFPAISGGIRIYQSLAATASKIAAGGDPSASILIGLEHNGLSRPLGGMAQLAQGFGTTSSGKLISSAWPQPNALGDNTAGLTELFNAGVFSRLLGARPLDDAIAMEAEYRTTAYKAKDTARLEALGAAVKTTLYGNVAPTDEQLQNFSSRYAAAGGRIDMFGKKMIEWSSQANASVANQAFKDMRKPLNQQMMQIMGGRQLQDFRSGGVAGADLNPTLSGTEQ